MCSQEGGKEGLNKIRNKQFLKLIRLQTQLNELENKRMKIKGAISVINQKIVDINFLLYGT